MDPPRWRCRHRRHHRLCPGAAGGCGLRRAAGGRPQGRAAQGDRHRRVGEGGERDLRPGLGRGGGGEQGSARAARHGQQRSPGRRLVLQAAHRRQEPARQADGRGRLQGLHRGPALMRYLPLTDTDRRAMLARIGVPSVESLYRDVPELARLTEPVDLPFHLGELEVEREISALAAKNLGTSSVPSFLGAGAYRHHIPAAVDHLIQRGEFLTSYTPYQPEITQGTLQYLFEFQTQVCLITGMEVANASMYDGATATAEAVMMANRVTRRRRAILSGNLHPHYREVTATHARFLGFEVVAAAPDAAGAEDLIALIDGETSCVVVQNPDFFGHLRDHGALAEACRKAGALLIVAVTEPVSLGLVESPGAMGADIVTAEGQPIGNALSYGGPYLGLFAAREKYVRQMPGRLVGETADVEGKRGWVLTLSTREQHIRREKATSNICTNSGL